jgi:hypothetical protein
MPPDTVEPPFDQFLTMAEVVARTRPEVDLGLAREVFHEVATTLYNGLALDGLDDHDTKAAVDGLCDALISPDPGAAVRERARESLENAADLHDPEAVSAAYLVSARILQI